MTVEPPGVLLLRLCWEVQVKRAGEAGCQRVFQAAKAALLQAHWQQELSQPPADAPLHHHTQQHEVL
jgi:hypothetical protein